MLKFGRSSGTPPAAAASPTFLKALARYYRDFLDSDFKRQRLPKRSITNKDRAGNLTGIPLRKYPSFQQEMWRKLTEVSKSGTRFSLPRNRHRSHLPKNLLDLIDKQASTIDHVKLESLHLAFVGAAKELRQACKGNPEAYKARVVERMNSLLLGEVVRPFLDQLEGYFKEVADNPIETIFEVEDELTERLIADIEDGVGLALNTGLVEGNYSELEVLLAGYMEVETVRSKLREFFAEFVTGDLYSEFHNLLNTVKLREGFEIYLYIGELHYGNHAYPLFYLPLIAERQETTFQITVAPHIYVNKKALDYVALELARASGKSAASLVEDRILYLDDSEVFAQRMQPLLDEWAAEFSLRDPIDLGQMREQSARSLNVVMTNRLYLAAFDKADESLLNDYEELLINIDRACLGPISDFVGIVKSFLTADPVSVDVEVDKGWDETPPEDRLVYKSPIPLNEQQRKIASALQNPKCRFVAVQGPPGSGKSHTITALAFDAILNGQNVLVLSDKNEALDVVQDKLSETLSTVRLSEDFQNPILRLGRASNTFTRILSGASIEQIKVHATVAEAGRKEFAERISTEDKLLKEKIKRTMESYQKIDIQDLISFQKTEGTVATLIQKPQIFVDDDILARAVDDIEFLRALLKREGNLGLRVLRACQRRSLDGLGELVKIVPAVSGFKASQEEIQALRLFSSLHAQDVDILAEIVRRYQSIKLPLLGFLFSRAKARAIDAELGEKTKCVSSLDAHRKIKTLISAQYVAAKLRSRMQEEGLSLTVYDLAFQALVTGFHLSHEEISRAQQALSRLNGAMKKYTELDELLGEREGCLDALADDAHPLRERIERLIDYKKRHAEIKKRFDSVPVYDYPFEKAKLESLFTQQLANTIDKRVIDFHENKRATAKSLGDIIRKKQRFPKDKFEDLKNAFPCIIANIREYAEYVPLEPGLFDLVIIDEASQVSIAQAFPAILRAKKLVVLGDHNQFSNVKTVNASIEINNTYMNELEKEFREEYGNDQNKLTRLRKFNIKTSILEFVEMIANFAIMLRLHLRGYPELISFSSKYFYRNALQAVKIRGKSIDDVLKFTVVNHDGKHELKGNVNHLEAGEILRALEELSVREEPPTVGIITPFTDQQRYLARFVQESERGEELHERLRLKVMTFDTCQGEERDVIIYSMVASPIDNKLNAVFPKDLARNEDVETILRMQRLNVGFSRAKECIQFVLSMPVNSFAGAIGTAIRHFESVLEDCRKEPTSAEVDPKSPMEAKLLHWLKQTEYYVRHRDEIEIIPQFPIGKYLRQLDPAYSHPGYRVDFLLRLKAFDNVYSVIIEYDGFAEHFSNLDEVDATNYHYYLRQSDIEREKILEGYGYRILRVNRFNLGKDPVVTLSERLFQLSKRLLSGPSQHELIKKNHETIEGIENGELKRCTRCGQIKPLEEFQDSSLKTGYGRVCKKCKKTEYGGVPAARIPAASVSQGTAFPRRDSRASVRTESAPSCPRCHSHMVRRHGKFGTFWGCSRFPYCRGTRAT